MLLLRGSSVPVLYFSTSPAPRRPRALLFPHLPPHHFPFACTSASASAAEVASHPPSNWPAEEEEEEEGVGVKELEDLPEQWRRSKVAWLCKELPSYNHSTFTRILNAQRKWLTQNDATYVLLHCLRIRENESAFRVYKWMERQHWYKFNFPLATKLADCLGKERRVSKCRDVFDDIIRRGQFPKESTFHVLIVAYLSAPVEGSLEEACSIYNQMIRSGGYRPSLSLQNSLFRTIVSRQGVSARHFLDQAECIFRNLQTCGLEIQKDIYAGLIWLHSYQDVVDWARIDALREEMCKAGFSESRDVLVSIMRACSKMGDAEEGKRTWNKILELGSGVPSQAFVYQMEIYAKINEPMRALDLFRSMNAYETSPNVVAYQKIIEVMSRAKEVESTESLMVEFMESGLKPLAPSFTALMDMYLSLEMHAKLELAFHQCLVQCKPNRNIYNIYLDSLVRDKRIEKAEEIFNEMQANEGLGTSAQACNIILRGFLESGDHSKVEKLCDMMLQKKYDIDPAYLEKIHYIRVLKKKVVKKPVSLKLDIEQREILMGLLLGGLTMEAEEHQKGCSILFEFEEDSDIHHLLRTYIYNRFHEWLCSHGKSDGDENDIPLSFSTITHVNFDFFVDQFWPKGRLTVPRLIHRWLSNRVLAYWYMYGGLRTSSGDILLKLRVGRQEDAERVVKCFLGKSLSCRVKRKGKVFWIGFQSLDAVALWNMIEPYILDGAKEVLNPESCDLRNKMESIHDSDAEFGSHIKEEVTDSLIALHPRPSST